MERSFHKMKSAFLYLFVHPACYAGPCMTGRKAVIRKIYDVDVHSSIIKILFILSVTYFQNSSFCIPSESR